MTLFAIRAALLWILMVCPTWAQEVTRRAEPWRAPYTGTNSVGAHVLGHWRFEAGAVTNDSSGKGRHCRLVGAVPVANGRFGGGVESFRGWPVSDRQHAAVVANHASLSPKGAFTVELWVRAKPELINSGQVYLLDKKYASQADYQLLLAAPDKFGARRMTLNLGFGAGSESFHSEPVAFTAGEWHHVAFAYDGAGTVRFYRDGSSVGTVVRAGRGAVAPGSHPLCLGDRVGSYHGGFPGYIDEVRLCAGALEFSSASLALAVERNVFVRRENSPEVTVTVRNLRSEGLGNARLRVTGLGVNAQIASLPLLPAGGVHVVRLPFDTSLRPDDYEVRARLEIPGEPPELREEALRLTLAPRPLSRMPVLMWGIGSPAEFALEMPRLKDLGFTHCLGFGADYAGIWKAGQPVVATGTESAGATRRMLDSALGNGMGIAAALSPGYFLKGREELRRLDKAGKPYVRGDANAALPGLAEFCFNVGASVARAHGAHPSFQAALLNTEVRDDAQVSFSAFDREAYRRFSGRDIPAEVSIKNGVVWRELKDFPEDRVIADDHPVREFYRWYWTVGDGWNGLHSALDRGLKSTGRTDLWTWFDPAIRVPSIAGSGGAVDVLGQWTYTEPSPLRVGYFADEVFAMASLASPSQRVMKMTQLFWYRSSSAPLKAGTNRVANPFDDHDPDAAYITISPMHLRESFWTKLARPVAGLMYHGWGSLVPTDGSSAYKHTQPDTQAEFRRLHREVLEPLGAALLQVPDRRSEVAYLASFTAQMFARRGSYGYGHDEAYLTLLHAQLQPEVIFEETLLQRGLDGFKVLVLADCDVLTAGIAGRIREFQRRGGLVIGDPNLAPGIKADLSIPRFIRTRRAAADKATLLANAAGLRAALDARYRRPLECTNPEIVTRLRTAGRADYVFAVNDRREAGNYVGQHGLVQEMGLPSEGELLLGRTNGHVYDLVASREVRAVARGGSLRIPLQLGPCDGRVFLVTDKPVAGLAIEAPAQAQVGGAFVCRIVVGNGEGGAVDAVIPVRVEVIDPHGRAGEFSGYHAARGGRLELKVDLAANDATGVWEIRVRELASGLGGSRFVRVVR